MSIDRLNANGGPGLRLGPVLSRVGCNIYREIILVPWTLFDVHCVIRAAALVSKWSEDVTVVSCAVSASMSDRPGPGCA